jgi:tetratricopeptide (TPR) repeat protein
LPLAIEMVASWAGVLGLATLEAKLHRSGWLHGRTTAPPRHFTLDATLEWSHDLLCEPEQTVLRRLAVMAGNFNLQGAEAVAADVRVASAQIFKHVASLVRKSMIAVTPGPQPRRYRLLETTRVFMSDKLVASGDREATQRRHAQYVLCVIENAIGEWETTSDAVWKDRYGSAMDDLRDALDWAMASDYETAVALAGASWPLWRELSLRVEGRQRLSSAITRIHSGTPPELEARLRRGLGELLANTAAVKKAHAELERAATLYRKMGDPSGLGSSLTRLGYTFFMLDRTDEANRTIAEALKLLEPTRFPRMLATAYSTQVCIESRLGRFAAAREAGEKAVRLCEAAGAIATSLRMEANLVEATFDAGNVDEAISKGRGLAVRLRDSSHSYLRGFVLGVLAAALTARGDLDEALRAAGEAAPLLRDDGSLYWLFDHLALRCGVAGRAADAALLAGYSQAVYRKMDHPREPMGSRAASRLRIILCDVLPDKEIAYLDSMGACLTEDEALTLALTADRNLRRS